MKHIVSLAFAVMLLTAVTAFAAPALDGYEKIKWGTDLHTVMKAYPRGTMLKLDKDKQLVYKQVNPTKNIAKRLFGFKNSKLDSVAITFSSEYVKKTGFENLFKKHKKTYGEGTMDRSNAPHMISYIWEKPKTRINFTYAPKRPDMTVLMYEQK